MGFTKGLVSGIPKPHLAIRIICQIPQVIKLGKIQEKLQCSLFLSFLFRTFHYMKNSQQQHKDTDDGLGGYFYGVLSDYLMDDFWRNAAGS